MKNLKIKVFLLGIFTIALGFWGVRVGAAEDLYRCTCVGTENGPKTPIGVFAMNSETECKARAAEGKAFLAGKTDPNNPLAELSNNYDCYWGKAELGRCECVITTSGGVVVDSESSAKDRIFIDNELGCKSFEESANKVFKAPGGSGSTANCTYKTISDGCYCNIERPNDLNSPMLVASAVIEKTEETCKDGGVGGDPSAPDYTSYTMCRYKKTEGTFGAGTLGGNPVGAVAGGGSVIAGPSFVNNAQNVGVYKGVGFINDGTSVKLANPLGAQDIKISTIIGRVIKTALGVMGSFAFLAFVYGGFLWLIAGGNDERVKKGKDSMVWATIGIFVIFSAYGLMSLFF
ncbi:MAG TPA: pilin, partial [Candidatus Magasanikbacteria bacterium]|nr:pilin [Candidatus Magasanikbacteria bacterium]